jgi:putative sigma-54 modulation protein
MASSLTTISANNLKMTDNMKAYGSTASGYHAPETPAEAPKGRTDATLRALANTRQKSPAENPTRRRRRYVEEKIGAVIEKYAGVSQRCDTHLSVMRNPAVADSDVAEVVVFCKGEVVRAEERSPSMYSSIDLVADKVARKLRKVKERKEGKRNKPQLKISLGEMLEEPVEMEPEAFDATSLIRRKAHAMPAQSLSDAMICMDGLDHDFYMFTNEESGKINVMYKRKEGGLGLIEPEA